MFARRVTLSLVALASTAVCALTLGVSSAQALPLNQPGNPQPVRTIAPTCQSGTVWSVKGTASRPGHYAVSVLGAPAPVATQDAAIGDFVNMRITNVLHPGEVLWVLVTVADATQRDDSYRPVVIDVSRIVGPTGATCWTR